MTTSVQLYKTLTCRSAEINCAAFSRDLLAAGDSRNAVHLFDAGAFVEVAESPHLDHAYPVLSCEFTRDGSLLASCSTDGVCVLRRTSGGGGGGGGVVVATLQHRVNSPMRTAKFSRDGRFVVTGSIDSTACVWDIGELKIKW